MISPNYSVKRLTAKLLFCLFPLALAAQNADRVWLLEKGRLVADGPPCDAMRPADLERVFHVPFHWHQNAEGRVFLTYGR